MATLSNGWFVLLAFWRETLQTLLAALWGRERLKRQQAERALKREHHREQIRQTSVRYHDRGKRGLLERLRRRQRSRIS